MPDIDLPFTRAEYAARLAKTRAAMDAAGVEVLFTCDPSNMAWLTGYDGWSFYVHQCVVITLSSDPIWFGRGQDGNGALRTCFMAPENIIGYSDHYVQSTERHPMDYLSAQLADRSLAKGRVGVEMDNYWFTAAAFATTALTAAALAAAAFAAPTVDTTTISTPTFAHHGFGFAFSFLLLFCCVVILLLCYFASFCVALGWIIIGCGFGLSVKSMSM